MLFERIYARRRPRAFLEGSTWFSLAVHGAAVAFVVLSAAGELITGDVAEGIHYFAPPTSASAAPGVVEERITFTALAGLGGSDLEDGQADGAVLELDEGTAAPQGGDSPGADGSSMQALASIFDRQADSVFFGWQVDNPVAYDARSAAPAYPDSLRRAGVEGAVMAQFVVDTTGRVDLNSFVLLESTHGRFTESVRRALPGMLFKPAELNGRKIKQLVQLPFVFRIESVGGLRTVSDTTRTAAATLPPDGR